jgi:hypothetical protein
MTDDARPLSRRRLLLGLGSIAGAGTTAGLGTTALVTDEEEFSNGRLTTGSLDLTVGWEARYHGATDADARPGPAAQSRHGPDCGTRAGAAAPSSAAPRPPVALDDVKPGDSGEIAFDVTLCGNPGYVWMDARLDGTAENGLTDPERTAPAEYSDGAPPTTGNASVLTVDNGVLEVNVATDVSGALAGQPWTYTFPDGRTEQFLFFEIYALRDDDARSDTAVGAFETDFPASGVPGTTYPGTYTVPVNGVDLSVTRAFTLDPVDALLTVEYRFENVDPTGRIADLRLTQYVDYDVGQFSNTDVGAFRSAPDRSVDWVRQSGLPGFGRGIHAGFGATRPAEAHHVGHRSPVLSEAFGADRLPGGDAYRGDVGFALEYSLGELAPGDAATLTTAFAVAESVPVLEALLLKPRLEFVSDLPDAVRTTLRDGNDVIFEGTLAQFLALAASGHGVPLGRSPTAGPVPREGLVAVPPACLDTSPTVHRPTLEWALPDDRGNEVQTDSVSFDLGFYAEQCRHNDGA